MKVNTVRITSNPAIRNLVTSSGSLAIDATGLDASSAALTADRPVTVNDIVNKTGISLGVIVGSAFLTVFLRLEILGLPALVLGLGIALYLVIKPRPSAELTLLYSFAQGISLGGATHLLNRVHPGIGTQAVIGTSAVFAGMLTVYRTRIIRVTPKITRWIVGAVLGMILLALANLLASVIFGADLGLRHGGVITIIISIACITVASFSFLLNFEAADRLIRAGASTRWAWYIAFALAMTLVWLYLEILWFLSRLP